MGDGVQVGVMAARPQEYDLERWCKTSAGAKAVVGVGLSLLWTKSCFMACAAGVARGAVGSGAIVLPPIHLDLGVGEARVLEFLPVDDDE